MDTKKMRACAPLLPPPGDSVVIECLDEIERLRLQHDPMVLATRFHETYERLAPSFGYETRADTKTFDPESKNGRLMVAVCAIASELNAISSAASATTIVHDLGCSDDVSYSVSKTADGEILMKRADDRGQFPRGLTFRWVHHTVGDDLFAPLLQAASAEYFAADPEGCLKSFTASNGMVLKITLIPSAELTKDC